jgi:hypothetical protein
MTHDLISNMLGVRREGITLAAQKLAKQKLIKNVRGTITITNRLRTRRSRLRVLPGGQRRIQPPARQRHVQNFRVTRPPETDLSCFIIESFDV